MNSNVEIWLETAQYMGLLSLAAAVVVGVIYWFQLLSLSRRTLKYQFVLDHEIQELRKASGFVAFAIGSYSFRLIAPTLGVNIKGYAYLYVGFLALIIAIAFGSAFRALLKFYYPFALEKRLNKIRFGPMTTKEGRPMRLLNEHEEDVHLTEEMLEEENAFSADYDVWIDESTGHKVIERYDSHNRLQLCDECGFRTMKDKKEEILKEPTLYEEGLLVKHYECTYCGHHLRKEVPVASWSEENKMAHMEEALR